MNPSPNGFRLRLDPFSAEYDPAIQAGFDDEPAAPVDLRVEQAAWQAVPGVAPSAPSPRLYFVDGVRRVEHRLLLEGPEGEAQSFGLLGSFGVGAACIDRGTARVSHEAVGRVCVVAGGRLGPVVEAAVGGRTLVFEPRVVAENTALAPLDGLQAAMREEEARLAEALAARADVVLLDGPLHLLAAGRGPVVGFVKRLVRPYLPPAEAGLLRRLAVGERTPLFLIEEPRAPRYSWYQRLARGRLIESALTGVVRLEASGALAFDVVKALADALCALLPRFASDAAHDPRAPSNLYPIGGLETRLRRLLGDPLLIRRAIEARLHAEVPA
jgi:hypothetical protein